MSVLAKGLAAIGVSLDGNNSLPKDMRTQKVFRALIQAVRTAEDAINDRQSESDRQQNEALRQNLQLHERVRKLEAELSKYRLAEEMRKMDLSQEDQKRLLGIKKDVA